MKHFYSIEYVDEDGDQCVGHALITEGEAGELARCFEQRGIRATFHKLSRDSSAVISPHGKDLGHALGGSN